MDKMTKKQGWAIFCITGYDVRSCEITKEEASKLIGSLNEGSTFEPEKYPGAILKRSTNGRAKKQTKTTFKKIWDEAVRAGEEAVKKCKPTPMVVAQHENMLDDSSPIEEAYYVEGGVCGFAWVRIKPATQSFAKWAKENEIGRTDSYAGGLIIGCHGGGQSYERNMAEAYSVADVLNKHGIKCNAEGRLD